MPRERTAGSAGRRLARWALALACAVGVWAVGWIATATAWAAEAPPDVPRTASGTCRIGDTWMVGDQSFFTVPVFSGTLAGSIPASEFVCLNHTAAAPEHVDATYEARLVDCDTSQGWVKYYVTITPPGATDGVTYNEFGLVGYQRVGGTVLVHWDFNGSISLQKRSSNAVVTEGNACYDLQGATYGVFESRDAAASHRADRALRTYRTDSSGTWKSGDDFAAGTYYVSEVGAPKGYALDGSVHEVRVEAGSESRVNAGTGYVTDAPRTNPVSLWATKADSRTPDGQPQGNASLAGAQFTVRYYDGYYDPGNLPSSPTRTWVVQTGDDGKAVADDAHLVGGDAYYRTSSGQVTVPLGTVTVQETKAPNGYRIGDGSGSADIRLVRVEGDTETLRAYAPQTFADEVMRGGMIMGKVDRQNGQSLPQGSASLAGAQFVIENASEHAVIVDGTLFQPGETVKAIEAVDVGGGRASASTDANCLPVGTYTVRECASAEGYLYDEVSHAWSRSFEITADGQVADLSGAGDSAPNRVVRGDFGFGKVDGQTMQRLAGVPFIVESATTGERHVVVTDENGMVSTAASWNAHTASTNANDAALLESGEGTELDESKLDPSSGIWFHGRTDAPCEPDDAVGALPYDTYTVTELACESNAGRELVSFDVSITREGRELDLGTVDDNAGPIVNTSIADGNGVKLVPAGTVASVTDTVSFVNLDPRESYTMLGSMHLVEDDGTDGGVVAEGRADFQPGASAGVVGVDFAIDTADLAGARIVAFEQLVDSAGTIIATHEDLAYEGQTIRVPEIATTLVDAADGDHVASAEGAILLVDTVEYRGLTPGAAYTVTGTLHLRGAEGEDLGPAADQAGQPVRAHATFVAAQSEGSVQVTFSFAAPDLAGCSVVAFEELSRRGGVYAAHADIADEGQTVVFPPKPEEPAVPDEPEAPSPEEPAPEEPEKVQDIKPASPAAQRAKPSAIAKTGDSAATMALVLVPSAAIGFGCAALAVRHMRRQQEIDVRRGPGRR